MAEKEEEEEEEIMIMEEEEMSTTATTALLPQDILMEILSRLPATSLVSSFKLVCKAWCTTIKDPDFVKMHLSRGRAINGATANSSLICKSGNDLFQFHPPFNFEGLPIAATTKTKLDFDSLWWGSRLVCSCNGLLCIRVDDTIILLNPSTRRYKISPKQSIKYPKDFSTTRATYGFGCCYNSTTNIDEYKVVRIVYFFGFDHGEFSSGSQVDIYSMSSNSWRRETKIIDYPHKFSNQQSGVSANEALHWVASCTNRGWDTVTSFDIRDEEFRQVPIPLSCHPTAYNKPGFQLNKVILMNMKGCLSMIHFSYGTHGRRNIMDAADLEIWVMKEYGIKESWTKEFVIRSCDTDPPRALSEFAISWTSNAYVLKGDQMLIEGLTYTKEGIRSSPEGFRKLVLYDINKRKIDGDFFKMIGVPVEPNEPYPRVDQVDYVETLVSLKSSIVAEE